MNLSEARGVTQQLIDALATVIAASAGVSEADFNALQNQKAALEKELVNARTRLVEESNAITRDLATVQLAAREQKALLTREIAVAEGRLADVQTQARVSHETMENSLREYQAKEIAAKTTELKRITDQVEQQRRLLDEINAQIEAGRKRFA